MDKPNVKKLMIVLGTRPEAIKLSPIIAELIKKNVNIVLVYTGQHKDLVEQTPISQFNEPVCGLTNINLPSFGIVTPWLAKAVTAIKQRIVNFKPEFLAVYGDTMSAYAAAEASLDFMELQLLHIEAGVRSGDEASPWPEERFRSRITHWADWHYATTEHNVNNLIFDHVRPERIILTGSSTVSALMAYSSARFTPAPLFRILITLHRREFILGDQTQLVVEAIIDEVGLPSNKEFEFLWPVHPHLRRTLPKGIFQEVPKNLIIVDPMPYSKAVEALAESYGVLTDSGGIQEEAATLGVPTAVLRSATDRPEAIRVGIAKLFEPTPLEARKAIAMLTSGELPRRASAVYGEPDAAEKIAEHIHKIIEERK